MLYSTRNASPRIFEVVINSRLSQAIARGKREASKAFAPSSELVQDQSSGVDTDDSLESCTDDNDDSDEGPEESLEDVDKTPYREVESPGLVSPRKRPYPCTYEGCHKAYTKPSRLAEHVRSHTGERPYACTTCGKSYLRETHLRAHTHSHLSVLARPYGCSEEGCIKRFWTRQHLGVHVACVHHGEKAFSCAEEGCLEAFAKHNQLKRHVAEKHSPPGTKPFRCEAKGCTKSFATPQNLRKHSKVHQEDRYACIDMKCKSNTGASSSTSLYFPTWTALQAHLREFHRPTCPYPDCGGRVFTSQSGLKGHLKVHQEREIEEALEDAATGGGTRPLKRRRGGEVGRDWACKIEGCTKAFKSKNALTQHHNIKHLGRKDYVCEQPECGAMFGYRHLLQRHTAKVHSPLVAVARVDSAPEAEDANNSTNIEWLTGKSYITQSAHRNARRVRVPCPWPDSFDEPSATVATTPNENGVRCGYIFSRAYDLRRHLQAEHGLVLDKEEVDRWVKDWRERHSEGD